LSKLEIISFYEKDKWNSIVKSFDMHDVYYLNEYVSAFRYTNDGKPLLIYYRGDEMRLCYVVQQSDIAESVKFSGLLQQGKYFDWSTPYGYGGPLTDSYAEKEVRYFFNLINCYCKSNNIVTQFIRFHPLLQNARAFGDSCDLRKLKNTVFIDTYDIDTIYTNMHSKNRNMVKKAQKNSIEIITDSSKEAKTAFFEIYKSTMQRNDASEYYYFSQMFFDDMISNLAEYYTLFSAKFGGKIISSAIIMHCNGNLHYHLSASLREYMHLAPNNLLLYTAACWGAENGFTRFHLGGGVGMEDGLYSFKKSFNKNGLIDFYIGRNVFCKEIYKELLDIRTATNSEFNPNNNNLIQYRA